MNPCLWSGPPWVWLQTLLLKHNRRVKQRQQNSLPLNCTKGAGAPEVPRVPNCCFAVLSVLNKLSSLGEFGETGKWWCHPQWFWRYVFQWCWNVAVVYHWTLGLVMREQNTKLITLLTNLKSWISSACYVGLAGSGLGPLVRGVEANPPPDKNFQSPVLGSSSNSGG